MPGPSIDSIKRPFERVATPTEAVDRLVRLYDEATKRCAARSSVFSKTASRPPRRPAPCSATPNCA